MTHLQSVGFDFIELLNFVDRPFRAKFIPAKIWDELDTFKNDSVGLTKYFKRWKCNVNFKQYKKITKYIPVGGYYLPDKNTSGLDLYTMHYDTFEFTQKSWDRLKYKILQVIMHELVHCRQYMGKHEDFESSTVKFHRTGISKVDEVRHYHSGRDEIEAYAHCIYLDFKAYKPNINITELIRRCMTEKDSPTFTGIIKLFGRDSQNNHALPLLTRKNLTWERKYKRFS